MDAYHILILLCGLVIFSYLFDVFAKRTRIPSVILLLGLGVGLRVVVDQWHFVVPDLQRVLPTLGTVGLILIVFEGALELTYDRSKNSLIRKSFGSALVIILLTTAAIAAALHYITGAGIQACIANAIPLSVVSSAVAIPSVAGLANRPKEFIVFESTFSDILGIMLFNFVAINTSFGPEAFGDLGLLIIGVLILSAVFSMALLWLLRHLKHHVKSFLVIAILVLVYAIGKQLHLSTLVVVLVLGMFLANAGQVSFQWFRERFLYADFDEDLDVLHKISRESAFLIRTFFFIIFGFSFTFDPESGVDFAMIAGSVVVATYLIRAIILRGVFKVRLTPLLYVAPRGLITILLYLSLPEHLKIGSVGLGVLFVTVVGTSLIMAIGLAAGGRGEDVLRSEQDSGPMPEKL